MKKLFITLALLASLNANAQKLYRNQWGLQPRVGASSLPMWGILNHVEGALLRLTGVDDMGAFGVGIVGIFPRFVTLF